MEGFFPEASQYIDYNYLEFIQQETLDIKSEEKHVVRPNYMVKKGIYWFMLSPRHKSKVILMRECSNTFVTYILIMA